MTLLNNTSTSSKLSIENEETQKTEKVKVKLPKSVIRK